MDRNPYAPSYNELPDTIPVFPLNGVLLLPFGELPLNIFEPRYLQMVDRALAGNRMIGMVQPQVEEQAEIYSIGCVGKITEFQETSDGRYMINLTGVCRFKVDEELSVATPYRQVKSNWSDFKDDVAAVDCLNLDRDRLTKMLQTYFSQQQLSCDWTKIQEASDGRLITCLSMICPFTAQEKQALLEAKCCKTRANVFLAMLEMAMHSNDSKINNH